MNGRKRVKEDKQIDKASKVKEIYDRIIKASLNNQEHPFEPIMKLVQSKKHPILPTLNPSSDVYKINNDKKKKPIEIYLDAINTVYKKKDLDMLINPVTYSNVYQNWAPREVAIFEQAILKFGKQFQYIAQLINTKNAKEVYQFYLQWKTTSHFKSFRAAMNAANRSNLEQWI